MLRAQLLSQVRLFVTLWAEARQSPLSMGFSRKEYWGGVPLPSAGAVPHPAAEAQSPASPASAGRLFAACATCCSAARGEEPTPLASPSLAGRSFAIVHLGSRILTFHRNTELEADRVTVSRSGRHIVVAFRIHTQAGLSLNLRSLEAHDGKTKKKVTKQSFAEEDHVHQNRREEGKEAETHTEEPLPVPITV